MKVHLLPHEIADALATEDPGDVMVLLATLASHAECERVIEASAHRHNGGDLHQKVAPWLRQMAATLEEVERHDSAIDAAGRVA